MLQLGVILDSMDTGTSRIPFFERDVDYVGVGKMRRTFTHDDIQRLRRPVVVMGAHGGSPIAVLISYQQYMSFMQVYMDTMRDKIAEIQP